MSLWGDSQQLSVVREGCQEHTGTGTCLVRKHSQGFTRHVWGLCSGWRDLFSPQIQGGWEHFFPVDAVALGGINQMLVVPGPGFRCALLQVNAPAWRHRGVFLLLFSFSVFMEFLHKWYFSCEALRVTCPRTLWHLPCCVQQQPGKLFPLTGRICYWLKLLSL